MALGFIGIETGSGGRNTDRATGAPDIAPLQALRGYWQGLRAGDGLPRRADIDPRGFAGALESAFLLERVTPQLARFRLCGMHLHELMGMDPTGMPLSVLIEAAGRERLGRALQQVFDAPAVLDIVLEAIRGRGRPPLTGRLAILPLTDRDGAVTMALGGLVTGGRIGDLPRQFAIATLMTEALARPGMLPAMACSPLSLPEFAEPASSRRAPLRLLEFTGPAGGCVPPRGAEDAPYLRLVHSTD